MGLVEDPDGPDAVGEPPPVHGELGAARRPGEQPYAEVLLQRRDPLGDGLLGDRQLGGSLGKLPGVADGNERADGLEIHANRP